MTDLAPPPDVLPHRPPFLFIDEVLECNDLDAVAVRTFRPEEDFFRGHFPDRPIVPGVILLEGMAQAFAYLALKRAPGKAVYLTGVDKARFRKPVVPGDTVRFEVEVDSARMGVIWGKAVARVDGAKVADAKLNGLVTDLASLEAAT